MNRKRRMTSIFRLFLLAVSWVVFAGILLLNAVPKVLLLDGLLSGWGLFLVAEEVREGVLDVELRGVRILRGGKEVVRFDRLNLGLSVSGVLVRGFCGEGRADLLVSPFGSPVVKVKRFPCVRDVSLVEADLTLGDGLRGVMTAEGLKVRGVNLDRLDLRFEGERFRGRVVSSGMELRGGGSLRINPNDITSSTVEGTFRGEGITLFVRGEIGKLSVLVR
ncbi:MAG: hypothetical protein Q9N26_01655 [Aquificota bacterium]|nr:hypothetical protein [Aquificota bacterium]